MTEHVEIKILLMSDSHLGMENDALQVPQKIRLGTFKRIINLAKEHDILLIAGDLFDNPEISGELIDSVKAEFTSLRDSGKEILITPGPGDLMDDGSVPAFLYDLNASHIFSNPNIITPYLIEKGGQNVYFYGLPASADYDISKIKKTTEDGFHIGLFHVNLDLDNSTSETGVFNLPKSAIRKLNLDFYALGHNHNFRMFKIQDRIIGTYAGSPEATAFNEAGDRYVISISLRDNEVFQIKRLTVNSLKVLETKIDCSQSDPVQKLFQILNQIKEKNVIHNIIFTGKRDFAIDYKSINNYSRNFIALKVEDRSVPSIHSLIELFGSGSNIRSEFYQNLKEKISSKKIPGDIDLDNLAHLLNIATIHGFDYLEEWLCK